MKDLRTKLTPQQRKDIALLKGEATISALAIDYGVSRRTIEFIQYPERKQANLDKRKARGGWKQYYNKDKAVAANKKYLDRKRGKSTK